MLNIERYYNLLADFEPMELSGKVTKIIGLTVEANGPPSKIGDICYVYDKYETTFTQAEVVGFKEGKVILMPFGSLSGIGPGSKVKAGNRQLSVGVGSHLIGRVLNALGEPMDDLPLTAPEAFYPVDNIPPNPLTRQRINQIMPLGVKSIDSMLSLGRGQRVGIFAGSGVGKSTLLGTIARNADADVNVIALVGERGREVRDFIEKDLGEEGLKKSILIVATSDMPALLRLKSAMVATAIAEFFRDQGKDVLLLMDSITRFAMAQREIGMSTGEPPVSRGYPPSVYTILPKLLERSGAAEQGSITAIYTVLVEGDDMNEPIADTVRGILDGHIILSRALANANHYPPIDVLGSVSRVMKDIVSDEQFKAAGFLRNSIATYNEASDLINIGAYKQGSNPKIDQAIGIHQQILDFLQQEAGVGHAYPQTLDIMLKLAKN